MPFNNACTSCLVNNDCIFHTSNLSTVRQLTDNLLTFHFKKGQSIFIEGDIKKGIYFIKEGKVKCVRYDQRGREVIIKFVTSGECLEYSMFYFGMGRYEFCSICMEDTMACFLPYQLARSELKNNYELLASISRAQHKDMLSMVQIIMNGTTKNVRERVASAIIILQKKFGIDKNGFINIDITREEIANMSATTTESSIRFISEFQKEKIVNIKNKRIKILDSLKFLKTAGGV